MAPAPAPAADNTSGAAGEGGPHTQIHPLASHLELLITQSDRHSKNVQMLSEVERLCHTLSGSRVTFCKSGKDRTGMAVTLEQSRALGERFGCGVAPPVTGSGPSGGPDLYNLYREDGKERNEALERLVHDAQVMRLHGPRLQICHKNIGKPVYSINKLQAQFLPLVLRPPPTAMEKLFKGGDNS